MKVNRNDDLYVIKMDIISLLQILPSYNELLPMWHSILHCKQLKVYNR